MKAGTQLTTERLIIRHWTGSEVDREALHALNSDEKIMHFFPFRRNRQQSDEMLERIFDLIATKGLGWAAICLRDTQEPIGFSGLCDVNFDAEFTPATEIGWRLLPKYWGKGLATEAAARLIQHGFDDLALDKIVSFAAPQNTGSTNIMKRLNMVARPELDFNMPGIDDKHASLRQHVYYEITKQQWQNHSPNN